MKNIIANIKRGATSDAYPLKSGYDLAKARAENHQTKTGNKTCVVRIIDYVDTYENREREHFSFDVIEIIN